MLVHKPVNFEDERGTIRDIFSHSPKDHCTVICSKKSAVRGNHFHKQSVQYTYVISGKMLMVVHKVDLNGQMIGEEERYEVGPGDLITHQPFEAHAMKALSDVVFLAFADGVRGGNDYEKDVFRLATPLLN